LIDLEDRQVGLGVGAYERGSHLLRDWGKRGAGRYSGRDGPRKDHDEPAATIDHVCVRDDVTVRTQDHA
jgi:hypothetical protein